MIKFDKVNKALLRISNEAVFWPKNDKHRTKFEIYVHSQNCAKLFKDKISPQQSTADFLKHKIAQWQMNRVIDSNKML